MAKYSNVEYWDSRYQLDPEPFEWYQNFEGVKNILKPLLHSDLNAKILQIGCGNSRFAEDLYFSAFRDITNIDNSRVVIQQMQKRNLDKVEMKWMVMDATKLEFNDSSFDLIFDKGTLDSILCGENAEEQCDQTLRGISRCLRPNCAFVCVSFGSPENRLNYLENAAYGWTVAAPVLLPKPQLIKVESKDDDDSQHFVYVCTKQAKE